MLWGKNAWLINHAEWVRVMKTGLLFHSGLRTRAAARGQKETNAIIIRVEIFRTQFPDLNVRIRSIHFDVQAGINRSPKCFSIYFDFTQ
jgi:hypothetical protein